MKEATGELNMTVVTLIAVAALGAIFYFVVWPLVQRMLMNQTCSTYGYGWKAIKMNQITEQGAGDNAKVYVWKCCPSDKDGKVLDDGSCVEISSSDDQTTD